MMHDIGSSTTIFGFLKRLLSPPIFADDQNKTRRAKLANTILWTTFALLIPVWLSTMVGDRFITILIATIYLLFLLMLQIPLRQGHVMWASSLLIASIVIGISTIITISGTIRTPAFVYYFLACIIAELVIGRRAALITGICTSCLVLFFIFAELNHILPAADHRVTLSNGIVIVAGLAITIQFLNLATKNTDEALIRARLELAERKKMETALRQSEERFRLISSVTSDYTFSSVVTPDGRLDHIMLTGAFQAITGYTPEEFLQIGGWQATIHPDDRDKDARALINLQSNHQVITESRIIHKNGSIRWVRVYALPVWDEQQNRLVGINGGVQDITKRKEAEEAMRRNEAHLRALLDATTDTAFLLSRDGTILTLNESLAKATGQTIEDLIGLNSFDFLEPELRAERYNHFGTVMKTKTPVRWEDKTGSSWWDNSVYPVLSSDGEVEAFAVYARDITENKRLEQEIQRYTDQLEKLVEERTDELRRAKEQLEIILNATNDALAFAHSNGDIVMTNPAYLKLFAKDAKNSIELILKSLQDDAQIEEICDALLMAIRNGESQHLETQIIADNGRPTDVDLMLTPIKFADEALENGVLLSGHDITHLKEIERFKERFVANAVHDLATPIAALTMRLYLLKRSPEKVTDHIRALEKQVEHLRNLLENLRTLSRLDRGKLEIKRELHDVNQLLKQVFELYEHTALEKQQSMQLKLASDIPNLRIDPSHFETAIVNLVLNAISYTGENKNITIASALEANTVVITVVDEGIGIRPKDLPNIFERFYRTSEARELLPTGTGLGLAITKEIIELHGGSIHAESDPQKGSTLTIRLPLSG